MDEKNLIQKAKEIFGRYSMIIILLIVSVFFQFMTEGIFLRPLNITNIVLQNSHILVLAVGMLLVVLLGHVDLSVGSVVAVAGSVAAIMMVNNNISPWIAIPVCLMLGGLIGAWNGFWVAYFNIPAFIVTLSGLLMYRGITQILLGGTSIAPFPTVFQKLSSGYLPRIGNGSYHTLTIILGIILSIIIVGYNYWTRKKEKKI